MKKIELYPGLLVKDTDGDVSLVLRHHDKLYGVCFYQNGDEGLVFNIDPDEMTVDGAPITKVYGSLVLSPDPDAVFRISSMDRMVLWEREEESKKKINIDTPLGELNTTEDKLEWIDVARDWLKEESKDDSHMKLISAFLNPLLDICEHDLKDENEED